MKCHGGLRLVLAFCLVSSVGAIDCSDVPTSKPNELVQFLKTQAREADSECVSRAITRLGGFRSNSGTDVLIDLLDFQRPESQGEKLDLFDAHDKFPAVPALFSIGMPVVPSLIAKLQSQEPSDVLRSNAIRTLVIIYRDNPVQAITVLMDAADAAKTQDQAVRLESCAEDAIKLCGSRKAECEAARTSNR